MWDAMTAAFSLSFLAAKISIGERGRCGDIARVVMWPLLAQGRVRDAVYQQAQMARASRAEAAANFDSGPAGLAARRRPVVRARRRSRLLGSLVHAPQALASPRKRTQAARPCHGPDGSRAGLASHPVTPGPPSHD